MKQPNLSELAQEIYDWLVKENGVATEEAIRKYFQPREIDAELDDLCEKGYVKRTLKDIRAGSRTVKQYFLYTVID